MKRVIASFCCALALSLGTLSNARAAGDDYGSGKVPADPVELYNALDEAAAAFQARFANDDTCPRNLDVPILVFPVTRYERLAGYSFTIPRVCLTRGNQYDYISQIHYITDALTRAAHRSPLILTDDESIDSSATHAAVLEAISSYIDADHIDRIDLIERDLRLIR